MAQNKSEKRGRPPTHGAASVTVAQRYDDLRTEEGKALKAAIDSLMDHYGGPEAISSPMQITIDAGIRPKLIVLTQISRWVNKQSEIVDAQGNVPDVLSRVYIAYTNSLMRDLQALSNMAKEAGSNVRPPSIDDIIG
jgi:hypothetical protein